MSRKNLITLTFTCILIGTLMRIIWPEDMEFKSDELRIYEIAMAIANQHIEPPLLGIGSGAGFKNPGMSTWAFALLAMVSSDPIGMVKIIMWLNVLTLFGFFAFVIYHFKNHEAIPWLWGIALCSVSVIPVILSRKIWAQCLMPPIAFCIFLAFWYRRKVYASFLFGLIGACIGQIHMSGFFFSFSLLTWAIYQERKELKTKWLRWLAWFTGSLIGTLPLIPWLGHLANKKGGSNYFFWEFFTFKFFTQWNGIAFGINIKEYLGDRVFFTDFIRYPIIAGMPTYLMAIAHLFLAVTSLYFIFNWLWLRFKLKEKNIFRHRYPVLTNILMIYGVIGGLTYSLSGFSVHAHYLLVFLPLPFVWYAMLSYQKDKWILASLLLQFLITITFLILIHTNRGYANTGYGKPYHLQNYKTPIEILVPRKPVTKEGWQ